MTIVQFKGVKGIICDIEGTTASIEFVHQTLFPFAKKHLGDFLRNRSSLTQERLLAIDMALAQVETLTGIHALEGQIKVLEEWMEADQKITPLKVLQGLLWESGYESGAFKGHFYQDAFDALIAWHQQGIKLFLYSSGSVKAQKLLFAYSEFGDQTGLWLDYFDTNIGGKRESQAYLNIYHKIQESYLLGIKPNELLFISDIIEELIAAQSIGLQIAWSVREDNRISTLVLNQYPHISKLENFSQIQLL